MNRDEQQMQTALELAGRGRYSVSPNPMVGCVIVRDDSIIAEGWHHKAGLPHAEINALEDAGASDCEGATIYVTLEPCTSQGRTPPCVDALVEASPARVVVATIDPSPEVAGAGIARLRSAGIEVTTGVLESEARKLNEKFFRSIESKRPFVLLKAGMTLDGKLATVTGRSQWITSTESRQRSLLLREEYDAILIGSVTLSTDNPRLTRRLGRSEAVTPWTRTIIHTEGAISHEARLLNDGGKTILYTSVPGTSPGDSAIVVEIDPERAIESLLDDLHARNVRSLIVEGGSRTLGGFLRSGLWDRLILFVAPMMIGGNDAPSVSGPLGVENLEEAHQMEFEQVERAGPDLIIHAIPRV